MTSTLLLAALLGVGVATDNWVVNVSQTQAQSPTETNGPCVLRATGPFHYALTATNWPAESLPTNTITIHPLRLEVVTNWVTVSRTTPVSSNPLYAIATFDTLNQVGTVTTNLVLETSAGVLRQAIGVGEQRLRREVVDNENRYMQLNNYLMKGLTP